MTMLITTSMDSPVGRITVLAGPEGLAGVYFQNLVPPDSTPGSSPILDAARTQLDEYFRGARTQFDLALAPTYGTEFQRRVWKELSRIPHAETITYAMLAERIGKPSAVRAVGGANARNPIGIVVPCHRVIGADGLLTGFAGGMEAKRWLLAHEARAVAFALTGGC